MANEIESHNVYRWPISLDNVNDRDEFVRTLLHIASQHNDLKLLQYLIDNGADVNVIDKFDQTALQIAAKSGYLKIQKLLNTKNVI